MTARKEILETVKERRGISFSQLKDKTGRGNGTVQHHVNSHPEIEKRNKAIVHLKKCRECPLRSFCTDKCIKMLLEHPIREEIILRKLEGVKNTDIASDMNIHRSTVSYHLSKFPELSEDFLDSLEEEV